MPVLLDIQAIKKSYSRQVINLLGKRDQETSNILDGVSLRVEQGTITALLGGNGSGKTTLFNIICGYLKADAGKVLYQDQHDLARLPSYQTARLGVGRMFQGRHIFKNMTVLENMQIADESDWSEQPFMSLLKPQQAKKIAQQQTEEAEKVLDMMLGADNPLWKKRNELAGTLSYGQQRLLALARLLMNDHLQLILLDEPCAGVNPDILELLKSIIKKLTQQRKTLLLIEHNLDFVKDITDYCYFLDNGSILAQGTYHQLMQTESVKNNYLTTA